MPMKKFWMSIAQTAGVWKRWRGIIGITANFHSTNTKIIIEIEPRTIIEITMGESQGKYVPPPEIGMRRRITPTELAKVPE